MTITKDDLKERVDKRKNEALEIKKIHDELEALRALHREENSKFTEQRNKLIFKDQIQKQTDPKPLPASGNSD